MALHIIIIIHCSSYISGIQKQEFTMKELCTIFKHSLVKLVALLKYVTWQHCWLSKCFAAHISNLNWSQFIPITFLRNNTNPSNYNMNIVIYVISRQSVSNSNTWYIVIFAVSHGCFWSFWRTNRDTSLNMIQNFWIKV